MSEDDDHLLLHALADGELDAAMALACERRLTAEPALQAAYDRIVALKMAMGRVEKPAVSDAFRARIAALAAPKVEAAPARRKTWAFESWQAAAASLLLAAGLASALTYVVMAPQVVTSAIEDGIVSGHRRSLLAASPIDIASSDRHTVRPWLDAKLGVAPPTPDLTSVGYTLVGGRVDVIQGRAVPTLVYRHNSHLITVVAVPEPPTTATTEAAVSSTIAGYNVVHWSRGGFRYWAVSDLDMGALQSFVDKLQKA